MKIDVHLHLFMRIIALQLDCHKNFEKRRSYDDNSQVCPWLATCPRLLL